MGLSDVMEYLRLRGVEIPKRTDCARCFYQRLSEWYELWVNHPEIYSDIERQENEIGHTWRSPGRDTWPAALKDLRKEFESGRKIRGYTKGDLPEQAKCRVCRI